MPYSPDVVTRVVFGTFLKSNASPATGTVTFVASNIIKDPNDAVIIRNPIVSTLDVGGHFTLVLPTTDNRLLSPIGWYYTARIRHNGGKEYDFDFYLPVGDSSDVDITLLHNFTGNIPDIVSLSTPRGVTGPQGPQGPRGGGLYTFATTPPVSPIEGDRWVNSTTGYEFTYVCDGDSCQWVDTRGTGFAGATGDPTTPATPTTIGSVYGRTTIDNAAIGQAALYSNTTGVDNVAVGPYASRSNTIGSGNTGVGSNTLYSNVAGNNNTAIGVEALNLNTSEVSTFGIITPGSGYTDGYYPSVSLSLVAGHVYIPPTANITISGGAVTAVDLVSGGAGVDLTSVFTADPVLIGYTGSGFEVGVTSILSGDGNAAIGSGALSQNTIGGYNVAVGLNALYSNTVGTGNVAAGFLSLFSNISGEYNIAVGYNALYSNTIGGSNNAFGDMALRGNTTGINNTALGTTTLVNNTTGDNNTAVGASALWANTTGLNNVAIGVDTLLSNTTGSTNVALGPSALNLNSTGNGNIAVGSSALGLNSTGNSNIATGDSTLYSNTTGSGNVATGQYALYSNTTGNFNIAVGNQALNSNTSIMGTIGSLNGGDGNYTDGIYSNVMPVAVSGPFNGSGPTVEVTVVGGFVISVTGFEGLMGVDFTTVFTVDSALIGGTGTGFTFTVGSVSAGEANIAIGYVALAQNLNGKYNIAVGVNALGTNATGDYNSAFGSEALWDNIDGSNNSAFGIGALTANLHGSNNSAFGREALVGPTGDNNVAIGNRAGYYEAGSNKLYISNTDTTTPLIYGDFSTSALTINGSLAVTKPIATGTTSGAPTMASATTIAPTTQIVFVSGTTAIDTITAPAPISTNGGTIILIPTGAFTTTTSGNIALASTAAVSKALHMTYDPITTTWYPSY